MRNIDKRNKERLTIHWPVHATGLHFSVAGAEALDINSNGLFLCASNEVKLPALGSFVRLTVFPNGGYQGVSTTGVVKWIGPSRQHVCDGLGIQFTDPEGVKKLNLDQLPPN
jgi:hypothetical protein